MTAGEAACAGAFQLAAQLTEKAPNPPSFCRKKVPFFVLGRRWPPAPAGKFSPHAGAATHGNGISKLATHPPQHADAPSLQLAAVVLSPFPSHRRAPAGKFSPHADALTHGNGISALATHPPLHADVPSLCSWLRWCSLPFLFTSTGMGGPRLESQPPALPSSWLLPCFDLAAWVALASLEAVTEAMWRWFMSAYEGVVRNCSQRTWSVGLAQ